MNISIAKILESVDRIFRNEEFKRQKPLNPNVVARRELGLQERIALAVTGVLGTMWAVYFLATFTFGWMLWQAHFMRENAFDPYPFAFLLFLGNIIQLLLMPLIMVSQNVQARHAELRAEEQYKATLSSYHDAEYMMDHLAAIDTELLRHRQLLVEIATTLGGTLPDDAHGGISVPLHNVDISVTSTTVVCKQEQRDST